MEESSSTKRVKLDEAPGGSAAQGISPAAPEEDVNGPLIMIDDDNDAEEILEEEDDYDEEITEEYNVWRKNAPYLYDVLIAHQLKWTSLGSRTMVPPSKTDKKASSSAASGSAGTTTAPQLAGRSSSSPTVDWAPHRGDASKSGELETSTLLLGTSNGEEDGENFLCIADVHLPAMEEEDGLVAGGKPAEGGYRLSGCGVRPKIRATHEGDVDKARFMPQSRFIVASRMSSGKVGIFDLSKMHSEGKRGEVLTSLRCAGFASSGFSLDWSRTEMGWLAASDAEEKVVHCWDVNHASAASPTPSRDSASVQPTASLKTGRGVADVKFHPTRAHTLGTCSADGSLKLWDLRAKSVSTEIHLIDKSVELNSLCFSPFNEHICLTGGSNAYLQQFDLRKSSKEALVHGLRGHKDQVYQVAWSPHHENYLASCSTDRRVIVWDLHRVGREMNDPEDAEDGDAELVFIHGGHRAGVTDVAWHPYHEWTLASVAADNTVMIWQPSADSLEDEELADAGGGGGDEEIEVE